MLLPQSFPAALAMMLVAMACWGSWTNTRRLARDWPLEYFHFDYAVGVCIAALTAAATGGMLFGSPDVLDDLRAATPAAAISATAAGIAVSVGNYLLMIGIARVGMTLAFPVSVGFALVVSTVLSYLIRPLGDPVLLAAGVTLVFCAVLGNSLVYRSKGSGGSGSSRSGLAICMVAGVLFSISGTLVARAMGPRLPLSGYGVSVLYAAGCWLAAASILLLASRWRKRDAPLSATEYLRGSACNHFAGLTGGLIYGVGAITDFLAAGFAGMAVAGAVGQANPLVAALWGILVWKEFRGASRLTWKLVVLMLGLYSAGLILLGLSIRSA